MDSESRHSSQAAQPRALSISGGRIAMSEKKLPKYSMSVGELVKNGRGGSSYVTTVNYKNPPSHTPYKADRY